MRLKNCVNRNLPLANDAPPLPEAGSAIPAAAADLDRWYRDEVRPLEPMIRNYLGRHFPHSTDIDEIVDAALFTIVRQKRTSIIRHTRALLFAIARNEAIHQIRRREKSPLCDVRHCVGDALIDEAVPASERMDHRHELDLLQAAILQLPPMCQRVVRLHLDGLRHGEIALSLGISKRTVEHYLKRGLDNCYAFITGRMSSFDARTRRRSAHQVARTAYLTRALFARVKPDLPTATSLN